MNMLKAEKSVNMNRNPSSEIQIELLKLHKPPQKSLPPPPHPERRWLWRSLKQLLKLLSVCGSMDLHRQIGPELRPELIERKEGRRSSF